MRLIPPAGSSPADLALYRQIEDLFRQPMDGPFRLAAYTVATLPDPADWVNGQIIVTNEVGGRVPAFSDGTNWRRVTDRAIVS